MTKTKMKMKMKMKSCGDGTEELDILAHIDEIAAAQAADGHGGGTPPKGQDIVETIAEIEALYDGISTAAPVDAPSPPPTERSTFAELDGTPQSESGESPVERVEALGGPNAVKR